MNARAAAHAWRSHAPAVLWFCVLAVVLTWPLAARLGTHIPGTSFDDNTMFLWNFWLLRRALADPSQSFFQTTLVFHPEGVNLALHSHAVLNAFVGATLFSRLSLPAAMNLTIIVGCALNGLSVYLLAHRFAVRRMAAVAAGSFFAAAPLFTVHLFGHFNYYTAWPLVLFVVAFLRAMERPSWHASVISGVALAAVVYTDYYYFVYALTFLASVVIGVACTADLVRRKSRVSAFDYVLMLGVLMTAAAAVIVYVTGGGVWHVAGIRISLRSGTNVRAVATALVMWWLWRRRRWTPTIGWSGAEARASLVVASRSCAISLATCLALMGPLLVHAFAMWRAGDYVTQTYWWRSAPGGVDPGTVLLGNPFNSIWGTAVARFYGHLGIDSFNDPLWLGVVPLVLLLTRRTWMERRVARRWVLVGTLFLLWTIGPYLTLFGFNSGLPLPEILLRYVPIVSNARIPAHAAVFVFLTVAVLFAMALSWSRVARSTGLMLALTALVLIDFVSVPFPTVPLDRPPLYERLAKRPDGGVLDLPVGIRDGFGVEGRFMPSVLYYQTMHGKPIAQGYVARLPTSVRARYQRPAMQALLLLSDDKDATPVTDPREVLAALRRDWHIRYIVLHTAAGPLRLRQFVEAMNLSVVDRDADRIVYEIEH